MDHLIGIVTIMIIVAIPCVGGILAYGGLRNQVATLTKEITNIVEIQKKISERQEQVGNEIHPAIKNGGIVTQDQLDRRIRQMESSINVSIDQILNRIGQLDNSNRRDHNITDHSVNKIVEELSRKLSGN